MPLFNAEKISNSLRRQEEHSFLMTFHCFKNQNHLCLKIAHQFFSVQDWVNFFLITSHFNFCFIVIIIIKEAIHIILKEYKQLNKVEDSLSFVHILSSFFLCQYNHLNKNLMILYMLFYNLLFIYYIMPTFLYQELTSVSLS